MWADPNPPTKFQIHSQNEGDTGNDDDSFSSVSQWIE